MGAQASSTKTYRPLSKSTFLDKRKLQTGLTSKQLQPSKLLSKDKYCKLIKKTLGLPLVFRNPYYARSFYTLFSPDKAQLRVEHVQKGVKILTSGTQAEKAGLVFDWLDRNHDGVVSREDLEQGLVSTAKVMCDALGYWLWLHTPRDFLEDEEDSYHMIARIQRLVPAESFQRFLDTVTSASGSVTREEWISPTSQARREAIECFTGSRCGDILTKLSNTANILSFSAVTPAPLSSAELMILEQQLIGQPSSLFIERIVLMRRIPQLN